MTPVRCWLFGHDWLHLDTHFVDGDRLASSHLCDRCDEERAIVLSVDHDLPGPESNVDPLEVDD
ncbi:hypothetical protein [Halorussus marinus]|uniref:hypothetical protein n=1 Tax=Halorussus marinus TaxID=2505976 RepID=UPI00106E50C5|nr:hypothetical protein [Halorussus marinus]